MKRSNSFVEVLIRGDQCEADLRSSAFVAQPLDHVMGGKDIRSRLGGSINRIPFADRIRDMLGFGYGAILLLCLRQVDGLTLRA